MPLALSLVPIDGQFDGCRSVMFVACIVCPRMHFAWEHHELLLSPAMLLGREDSFSRYLRALQLAAHVSVGFVAPTTCTTSASRSTAMPRRAGESRRTRPCRQAFPGGDAETPAS